MLLDVFLYNGEVDMARLRVDTLRDHVDGMVAVSSNLTHQGEPNPLTPPPDGCEWLIVEPEPVDGGGEGRFFLGIEAQHRNACVQAADGLPSGAVVMISDVDEIPDPSTFPQLAEAVQTGPLAYRMRMHGFALNYLYPLAWNGTTVSRVDDLAPQSHRNWRHQLNHVPAGWHLSWFGDLEAKRRKLRSFSHNELAGSLDVEECYRTGTHANGERMTVLSAEMVRGMDWPAPLFSGFDIPASWWAPED